jgi:hypothetical protein
MTADPAEPVPDTDPGEAAVAAAALREYREWVAEGRLGAVSHEEAMAELLGDARWGSSGCRRRERRHAGFMTDQAGMRAIGTAVARLSDNPYSPEAFRWGDVLRLRVGLFRIMYTVEGDLITILRVDRRAG